MVAFKILKHSAILTSPLLKIWQRTSLLGAVIQTFIRHGQNFLASTDVGYAEVR